MNLSTSQQVRTSVQPAIHVHVAQLAHFRHGRRAGRVGADADQARSHGEVQLVAQVVGRGGGEVPQDDAGQVRRLPPPSLMS